ncbi:MAG: FHA domain-containing protein [Rhodoglobus sp.]
MSVDVDDTRPTPIRAPGSGGGEPDAADTILSLRLLDKAGSFSGKKLPTEVYGVSSTVQSLPHSAPFGPYRFRVGDQGEPVALDRPVRLGRRPMNPRILPNITPVLLRVSSPKNEVSGTHLELRQVGSSVVVTDLHSTNGSVVMLPGSIPRKLRQGESVVVSPGTLVDIGDENILYILAMQRLG